MRKTPTELIAELEANRIGYKTCALFVVFESTTIIIDTDDGNRLQLLTEAILAGGVPFAWGRNKPGKLEFTLLPEWENESWANDYLSEIIEGAKKHFKKHDKP
ncbi:MAG TPA: hypothetical protein VN884_04405 [Candidatus Sulfotelmatobacter sp.]|nr:hypothetical protein [Candidatus Sulfotelmatobacter sp.]